MNITANQWDGFYVLMSTLAKEILAKVSIYIAENKYITTYSRFPQSVSKNQYGGWSTVNELSPYEGLSLGKRNYKFADFSSLISIHETEDKIRIANLDGYDGCAQFLRENTKLLSLLWYKEATDDIEIALCLLLGDILNRYIPLTGSCDYQEQTFKEVYTNVTNKYFLETLEFDICVPILFLGFESDNLLISDNISLTKMTEDFIRSKHFIGGYDAHFEKLVLDCATHMIIIKGYSMKNSDFKSDHILGNWRAYPIDIIDCIFTSIRTITGLPTGYAQIISVPTNNWRPRHCEGNLTGLTGSKAKSYPDSFLEYYWLQPQNSVNIESTKKIASLAFALLNNSQNEFKLACSRLNSSMLRNREEDTILDAIIGLELLLSDNDKGELTYKISSRMATISTLHSEYPYTPIEIQQSVSQIYRYRSDIVHSRKSRPATKYIKVNQGEEIAPVNLAIKYLSLAIEILAANPEFLSSKKIDELMMKKLQQPNY
ncbi:MAG: HEPN domain-containing protein [Oscillospiraceae bacterium]|nr:HEPN domain-containing protein [Oscillospiraceae bacterium]